jgi:uncharacterized iron-regulated protein
MRGFVVRLALLAIAALGLLAGCGVHTATPKAGDIYGGKGWHGIDSTTLNHRAAKAQVVLVGERHANPEDHQLQLRILNNLADMHPDLVVGIEWLESGAQKECDRLSKGELSTKQFAVEVEWSRKWGHNYAAYEPIFAQIKKRRLKLVALNSPVGIVRQIARSGIASLSAAQRNQLPPAMQLDDPDYLKYISDQFKGHGVISKQAQENFLAAQVARDETMAFRFAGALSPWLQSGKHGVLFVGRGHLEMGLGLAPRLERRLPGVKKLVVLPLSDHEAGALHAAGHAPLDDQVWVITKPPKRRPRGKLGLVLKKADGGLRILHVREQSPADKAGIRPGDLLTGIDGLPLKNAKGIHDAIKKAPFQTHSYSIKRGEEALIIQITLSAGGKQEE